MSSLRDNQNFFSAPRTNEEKPFFSRSGILSAEADAALTRAGMSELQRGYEAARIQGEASYLASDESTARRMGNVQQADTLRAQIGGLQQRAQSIGPSVPEFTDLTLDPRKAEFSLRKAGNWVAGAAGNAVGSMVDPILAGGATNLAGMAMQGVGLLPHPVAKGIGLMGKAVSTFGTPAAAFAPNVLQARGATYNSMVRDEELMNTTTDAQRDNTAWGSGALQAIPDTILPTMVAGRMFGRGLSKGISKIPMPVRVAGDMLGEGGTELVQDRVEKGALSYLNPNRDTSDDMKDAINNFAGGVGGSAAISGASHAVDVGWRRLGAAGEPGSKSGDEIDLNAPPGTSGKPNILESLVPKSKYKNRAEAQARADVLEGLDLGDNGSTDFVGMAQKRKAALLEELSKITTPEAKDLISRVERVDVSTAASLEDPAFEEASNYVLPRVGLATPDIQRLKNNREWPHKYGDYTGEAPTGGEMVPPRPIGPEGKTGTGTLGYGEQLMAELENAKLPPEQTDRAKEAVGTHAAKAQLIKTKMWDMFAEDAGPGGPEKDKSGAFSHTGWVDGLSNELTSLATVGKPTDVQKRRAVRLGEDLIDTLGPKALKIVEEADRVTGGSELMSLVKAQLAESASADMSRGVKLRKQALARDTTASDLAFLMPAQAEEHIYSTMGIDLSNPRHREDVLQLFEDFMDGKSTVTRAKLVEIFGQEFTDKAVEFVGDRIKPSLYEKPAEVVSGKNAANLEGDEDVSTFVKDGHDKSMAKVAPESMVFHHGPSQQVREAKDAFTAQKNSKGDLELPQLLRLDKEGNEEIFNKRLADLNKKAETALGDQRDRYAVSTISAKEMMDRQGTSPEKRVDLMLGYMRKEKHASASEMGGMVGVMSKLEWVQRTLVDVVGIKTSLAPDGRKLSITERANSWTNKVDAAIKTLRTLVAPQTAEALSSLMKAGVSKQVRAVEASKIAMSALSDAQKHLTDMDEFSDLAGKLGVNGATSVHQLADAFFDKHFLSVAEQPETRDHLRLSLSEFRAMAAKGAANSKSAFLTAGADEAAQASVRASMNLIHFEGSDKGPTSWARHAPNSYEVSSAGDSRFSALTAKLKDGRTVEEAYQIGVKGHRSVSAGKGKAPVTSMTRDASWKAYKALWQQWAKENPELINELREASDGKILTDKFAATNVSQARALSEIISPATNAIPAHMLVDWVRSMRDAHERIDSQKKYDVRGESSSATRQTEDYRRLLLEGISAVMTEGYSKGMPYIINSAGEKESFRAFTSEGKVREANKAKQQARARGLPPSLDLDGTTQHKYEVGIERARKVREVKAKQHTVTTKLETQILNAKDKRQRREERDTYKEAISMEDPTPTGSWLPENPSPAAENEGDTDVDVGIQTIAAGGRDVDERNEVLRLSLALGAAVHSTVRALNRGQARTMAGRRAAALRAAYLESKGKRAPLEEILDLARTMRLKEHYAFPLAALLTPKFMSEIRGSRYEAILTELRTEVAAHLSGMLTRERLSAMEKATVVDYLSGYNDMKVNKALDAKPPSDPAQREAWGEHQKQPLQWHGEKISLSKGAEFLAALGEGAAVVSEGSDPTHVRAPAAFPPSAGQTAWTDLKKTDESVKASRAASERERKDRSNEGVLKTLLDEKKAQLAEDVKAGDGEVIAATIKEINGIKTKLAKMEEAGRTANHYDALYEAGMGVGASSDRTTTVPVMSRKLTRKLDGARGKKLDAELAARRAAPSLFKRTPSLGTAESKVKPAHTVSTLTTALQKMFAGADVSKAVSVFQTVAEALRAANIKVQDAMLSVKSDRLGLEGSEKVWFQTFEQTMPKNLFTEALKAKAGPDHTANKQLEEYAAEAIATLAEEFTDYSPERINKMVKARNAQIERLIAAYEAGAMLGAETVAEMKRHLTSGKTKNELDMGGLYHVQKNSIFAHLAVHYTSPGASARYRDHGHSKLTVFESHLILSAVAKHYEKDPISLLTLESDTIRATLKRMAEKPNDGGFLRQYDKTLNTSDESEQIKDSDGGTWRKYSGVARAPSLAARAASGWCTSSPDMAHSQLRQGDFYVYSDKNGTTQLALRLSNDDISEMQDRTNSGSILEEDKSKFEFIAGHIWPAKPGKLGAMRDKFSVRRAPNTPIEKRKMAIAFARILGRGKGKLQAEEHFDVLTLLGVPAYWIDRDGGKIGIAGDFDAPSFSRAHRELCASAEVMYPGESFVLESIGRIDGDLIRGLRLNRLGINDDDAADFDERYEDWGGNEGTVAKTVVGGEAFFSIPPDEISDFKLSVNLLEKRMLFANSRYLADKIRAYTKNLHAAVDDNPTRIPYILKYGPGRSRDEVAFDPSYDLFAFENPDLAEVLEHEPQGLSYLVPPAFEFGPYVVTRLHNFDFSTRSAPIAPRPSVRTDMDMDDDIDFDGLHAEVIDFAAPLDMEDDIPFSRRTDGAIQGFYDPKGKKTYLIADNVAKGDEMAVVLHEVGVHLGMEKLLGKERYQQLVGQIKKWETEGFGLNKKIAQAARARLEAAGVKGKQTDHELVAYFVEEAVKAGIDPTKLNAGQLGKWLSQVWDAIKTALSSLGWDTSKLQARDVVAIAHGAALIQMGGTKPSKKEVQGYVSEKAKAETKVEAETEVEAETKVEAKAEATPALLPSSFTNHSGGALGADSMFDTVGTPLGFMKHNHYYHGRQTPKGNVALTDVQVAEGVVHAKKAAAVLKRPWSDRFASLLGRNWFQVKNATQVIAIAPLIAPGKTNSAGFVSKAGRITVDGGTGYAVEMAIANGKETHVFDTKTNQWFTWDGGQFVKSGVPTLAQNYAGIGSRQDKGVMTKESVQAIRDVYEKASGVKHSADTAPNDKRDGATQTVFEKVTNVKNNAESVVGSGTKPKAAKKTRKPKINRQNALGMETVEGAAKNMDSAAPTALAVSSAMAHFKRTVSDTIKVIFAESFPEMKWGASFDTTALLAKISTATPDRIMRYAYHESVHAMYATILKHHPEAKKLLESVMSSPAMVQRLKDLLVNSPDAIAQMEADPEERVAYAYQFWQLGMLDIDKTPATFFAKVSAMLRRVFGTVRDSEKALALLEAFNKGELKEESAAAVAIRKVMATGEWQAKFRARFDRQIEAVYAEVMTAHDGMLNSESATLKKIGGMFWANPADPESAGTTGVLDRRMQMKNKYLSSFYSAIDGFKGPNQERDLKAAVDLLNGKTDAVGPAVAGAVTKLRALLDHAYNYAKSAGVQMGERDKGVYFPVVWSVEDLVERKKEFVDMLVTKYPTILKSAAGSFQESSPGTVVTINDVAESIHQILIDRGGVDDGALEAHREDGILNPFFASRNTRSFDWIRAEDRQSFLSTDLVATTTRYLDQLVRSAEYVRAFGVGGQDLKDMMARKGDVQMSGKGGDVLYAEDGPAAKELAQKAEELGLKDADAEAWINRRMEDAGRNMGAMEGVLGKDISETARKAQAGIMSYQAIRLLTLSLFSATLDINGIKVAGGTWQNMLDAFIHGMTNVVGTWKDLLLGDDLKTRGHKADEIVATVVGALSPTMFLEGMGAAHTSEYSAGTTRKFNRAFFLANGLTVWDRSMRIMATKAAIQSIEASTRNSVPQHSTRWLKELGLEMGKVPVTGEGKLIITPQELAESRGLIWKDLTPEQATDLRGEINTVHVAINRWVNRAIISPNSAQRPARGSDPHYALFFQLKSFTYAFQKTTMTYALHEAEAGNHTPAAQLLVGMPIMIAADVAKAILTGGGSLPGYMANWTIADWVNHAWARSGGNGIGQFAVDMTNDPNGILSGVISTIGGPTVSQILHPDLLQAIPVANKLGGLASAVSGLGDSGP